MNVCDDVAGLQSFSSVTYISYNRRGTRILVGAERQRLPTWRPDLRSRRDLIQKSNWVYSSIEQERHNDYILRQTCPDPVVFAFLYLLSVDYQR